MDVRLLTHTEDILNTVYTAARTCYSKNHPSNIWDAPVSRESVENLLTKVLNSGHFSVLEHVSFTFAVSGISRSATHQLVRHRIASYSQQSQRFVRFRDLFPYISPPSISRIPAAQKALKKSMHELHTLYNTLLELGIPAEDARYVLPNAAATNIVVTFNARSLQNFLSLRCCHRAQWEIRTLAEKMVSILQQEIPLLFDKSGAPCEITGTCPEGEMSCGKPKKRKT